MQVGECCCKVRSAAAKCDTQGRFRSCKPGGKWGEADKKSAGDGTNSDKKSSPKMFARGAVVRKSAA